MPLPWKTGMVGVVGVWIAGEVAYAVYCRLKKKNIKHVDKRGNGKSLVKSRLSSDKNNLGGIKDLLKQRVKPNDDESSVIWNTVMFFPDHKATGPDSLTKKFIWYLNQAEKAIKICMYVVRCPILEKAVFDIAESKNIIVMAVVGNGSCIKALRAHGVMTRIKPTVVNSSYGKSIFVDLMHNKFVILDDKVVMGGSLNWTTPAVMENRENVVVFNNRDTVAKYVERFEDLWNLSEPEPYSGKRGKRQSTKKGDAKKKL